MTEPNPVGGVSPLSRPAAHFDTSAISVRSVWAASHRVARREDAYRRSRHRGVTEWAEIFNNTGALPPQKPTAAPNPAR